jgi:predicted O-methyltransferase YrrM
MKWYHPSRTLPDKPWLHPDAIAYLESILQPDFRVCEFGGGGSTMWLSKRVKHVTTCEPDEEWFSILLTSVPDNVGVFFTGEPYVDDFDLVFIDGEPVERRARWIQYAPLISNTWIVLDNANRPEYAKEREGLKEYAELIETINSNEPGTLYLVTEFWRVK